MLRTWNKVTNALQQVENGIMVVTLSVMSLAALAQVLNRNIFMLPITWFEELSRYCMIYMTVFAAEAGLRDGTQISIDSVVNKFRGKVKLTIMTAANLILAAFAIIVFIYSVTLLANQIRSGQLTPSLRIPMSIPYFAMCIGFGSISVTQCIGVLKKIVLLFKKGGMKTEVQDQ